MENKRGYLGNIQKGEVIGLGTHADVYEADYNEGICAYKEFYDSEFVKLIKDRVVRISQFYGDTRFSFPYAFIYENIKDENFRAYVMNLLSFHDNLNGCKNLPIEEKINILKAGRTSVNALHEDYKTLHGNLDPRHIMYNQSSGNVVLTGFDSNIDLSAIDKGLINKLHSPAFIEYCKNNGVDKDADIFMYNLCSVAYINNWSVEEALKNVINRNYGIIESEGAKKILSTYKNFDVPKSLKKAYQGYIVDYM